MRGAAAAVLLATGGARAGDTVTIKGSDTLVVLVQRWAEEYMTHHPGAKIQVTGGGSGTGIAALLNGATDIASASRAMKPEEQEQLERRSGQQATQWVVARDGVTFYVNAKNPVSSLTLEQLRRLYMGDLGRWEQVGGPPHRVALYSRENSSGTYEFVKDLLLKKEDFAIEAQTLPGTAAVVNAVAQEPWGLGYGGAVYAKGVKELKIQVAGGEQVAPTEETIRSGKYPLSRDLYFYTRGQPEGAVRSFIDFALSDEGQRWVRQLGYYPVH